MPRYGGTHLENHLVDPVTGCWLPRNGTYRPEILVDGKKVRLAVYVYEQRNGPLPLGYHVHHTCGRAACFNEDHLVALTASDHQKFHRARQGPRGKDVQPRRITPEGRQALREAQYRRWARERA